MFWKAHFSPVHASADLSLMVDWIAAHYFTLSAGENGCLAVLHNRNDMVNAFNRSEWVACSESRIVSRGATSCAGMTAHHVILAQNKIGFLTGGRSSKLEDKEQEAQKEEAFARARVALTCAQRFCFLMCPLDMKGLIGTGTVEGSLQHGAGIREQIAEENPLILLRPPAMKLFYSCSDHQPRARTECIHLQPLWRYTWIAKPRWRNSAAYTLLLSIFCAPNGHNHMLPRSHIEAW